MKVCTRLSIYTRKGDYSINRKAQLRVWVVIMLSQSFAYCFIGTDRHRPFLYIIHTKQHYTVGLRPGQKL